MIAESIITFRETLEASIIVGITLSYVVRSGQHKLAKHVWAGALAGLLGSVLLGLSMSLMAQPLEKMGLKDGMLEGVLVLLAAAAMTGALFWCLSNASHKKHIEKHVHLNLGKWGGTGLFLFIFLSVLREGFETVVFLMASAINSGALSGAGALGGIGAAILLSMLAFKLTSKMDLDAFLRAGALFLILFGAGLMVHAVSEFTEAGLLPHLSPLWNTHGILDEESFAGSILHALFGYTQSPTLLDVGAWLAYVLLVLKLAPRPE